MYLVAWLTIDGLGAEIPPSIRPYGYLLGFHGLCTQDHRSGRRCRAVERLWPCHGQSIPSQCSYFRESLHTTYLDGQLTVRSSLAWRHLESSWIRYSKLDNIPQQKFTLLRRGLDVCNRCFFAILFGRTVQDR